MLSSLDLINLLHRNRVTLHTNYSYTKSVGQCESSLHRTTSAKAYRPPPFASFCPSTITLYCRFICSRNMNVSTVWGPSLKVGKMWFKTMLETPQPMITQYITRGKLSFLALQSCEKQHFPFSKNISFQLMNSTNYDAGIILTGSNRVWSPSTAKRIPRSWQPSQ